MNPLVQWIWCHLVVPVRVEGAVRHPDQLHAHGLHPVCQLDLHLLLQEVNTPSDDTVIPDFLPPNCNDVCRLCLGGGRPR